MTLLHTYPEMRWEQDSNLRSPFGNRCFRNIRSRPLSDPTFMRAWRESNPRPQRPQRRALSTELQAQSQTLLVRLTYRSRGILALLDCRSHYMVLWVLSVHLEGVKAHLRGVFLSMDIFQREIFL